MSNIRPANWPNLPAKTGGGEAVVPSGTRAAFFQAALVDAGAARPSPAPSTVQLQAQPQPQHRPAPARPFVQTQDPPQRILRPGSLVNILV